MFTTTSFYRDTYGGHLIRPTAQDQAFPQSWQHKAGSMEMKRLLVAALLLVLAGGCSAMKAKPSS
ncbi:MAG TPA: hypothetical protein VNT52_18835, partial [Acidimicrobiales bacterium]|nr:hypothetical protein [Acidimicrobiales bacterium]